MRVVLELITDAVGDLRAFRVTMSRVPNIDEIVRILATVNGGTTAFFFQVTHVVHIAHTDDYPRRETEIDAWVHCLSVEASYVEGVLRGDIV